MDTPSVAGPAPDRTRRSPTAAIMAPLSVHRVISGTRSSIPAATQRSSVKPRKREFALTPPTTISDFTS